MLDTLPYETFWFNSSDKRIDATFANEQGIKYRITFVSYIPNAWNIEIIQDSNQLNNQNSLASTVRFISTLWESVKKLREYKNQKYLIAASKIPAMVTFLDTALKNDINKYNYRLVDPQEYSSLDPYIQEVMVLTQQNEFTQWLIENVEHTLTQ